MTENSKREEKRMLCLAWLKWREILITEVLRKQHKIICFNLFPSSLIKLKTQKKQKFWLDSF